MVAIIGRKIPTTGATGYQARGGLGNSFDILTKTLMDPLTPALRGEALLKAQEGRESNDALRAAIGGARSTGGLIDPYALYTAGVGSGRKADDLGGFITGIAANVRGAEDPATTNALVGEGKPYSQTYAGFKSSQDHDTAKHRMSQDTVLTADARKPYVVLGENGPTVVRQSDAYGQPAVPTLTQEQALFARRAQEQPGGIPGLKPAEQNFISAQPNSQSPKNYVANGQNFITFDGLTDARDGQPLPPGGHMAGIQSDVSGAGLSKTAVSGLDKAAIARERFKATLDHTRSIAQKDPTLFGVTGQARNMFQEGVALAGNVSMLFGTPSIREAQDKVRGMAASAGVSPGVLSEMFDPNLPALNSASNLLIYEGAAALAGQEGRDVSDKDIVRMKTIFGDPQSLLTSQETYLAKLNEVEKAVTRQAEADARVRGRQPGAPAPAATPPAAAPQSERWERGPDGLPRRVQ
jgi:hypothetical protein